MTKEIERVRELARHNEASALDNAKKEGIKEGAKKRDAKIAQNLRSLGATDDFIAKALTGKMQ